MEQERLCVDNLIVETTRRCNAKCAHCLRGNTEALDMKPEYLDRLFQGLEHVSQITFTGGEPSLAPQVILDTIEAARGHGVTIGGFYIATNAIEISNAFLLAIMEIYVYCDDNEEMSRVEWSDDSYHPENKDTSKLAVFSFTGPRYNGGRTTIITEGRGADFGNIDVETLTEDLEFYGDAVNGEIYLNCEGNIIAGCNRSFNSQRLPENVVCHVNQFSLDALKEFAGMKLCNEDAA